MYTDTLSATNDLATLAGLGGTRTLRACVHVCRVKVMHYGLIGQLR